jgi:hypothetical protein
MNHSAAACEHCGGKVIGHGVESQGKRFCCARVAGVEGVHDRAGAQAA